MEVKESVMKKDKCSLKFILSQSFFKKKKKLIRDNTKSIEADRIGMNSEKHLDIWPTC